MDELIARFRSPAISDEEIATLATLLAGSGESLPQPADWIVADVPSTGGPSSLSTLLCPLVLLAGGAHVPKLGVPGRPAGGIDVLACIPGFTTELNSNQVQCCLDGCGFAHFLAGDRFAPLDAILFSYRQKTGSQNVPSLAIASLLSKKLAVGVKHVTLDVRVAPFTNFGDWEASRLNARRFLSVASQLGISATSVLSDSSIPYQGYIGRGESLLAIRSVFDGKAKGDLLSHYRFCQRLAETCLRTPNRCSARTAGRDFRSPFDSPGKLLGTV